MLNHQLAKVRIHGLTMANSSHSMIDNSIVGIQSSSTPNAARGED